MLKYFKKSEDYRGDFPSDEYYGYNGPIPVSRPRYAPGLENWLEAGRTFGYSIADSNGPQKIKGIERSEWESASLLWHCIALGRPKSRGNVKLNVSDVDGNPLIDFQFVSTPEDRQVLLEGIHTALKIFEETPSYQRLQARLAPIDMPACQQHEYRSEEFWKCFISPVATAFIHAAGPCRMGKGEDDADDAVVDSRLKVIGVEGLRVEDASIMPNVVNANLHAAKRHQILHYKTGKLRI
ncbi:unnamed protein product [Orchesella dallaii]|uniref:Glucose-methanol-choline oxidoreductase C-terminal domain-containing protein n=1 Tax=Orchesella dallaii TaxID=48710 RepID=A0ABP1RI88_9HEXA